MYIPGLDEPDQLVSNDHVHTAYVRQKQPEPEMITESAKATATADFADQLLRNQAMSVGLSWLEMEEPDWTFDNLTLICESVAACSDIDIHGLQDGDELPELSDDDAEYYTDLVNAMPGVFESLGAEPENVDAMLTGDEEAASEMGGFLSGMIAESAQSDFEIITDYAIKPALILEAMEKQIRDGKAVWVNKSKRKRRVSQKVLNALKRARKKANSSAAKRKRARSRKMGDKMGLNK